MRPNRISLLFQSPKNRFKSISKRLAGKFLKKSVILPKIDAGKFIILSNKSVNCPESPLNMFMPLLNTSMKGFVTISLKRSTIEFGISGIEKGGMGGIGGIGMGGIGGIGMGGIGGIGMGGIGGLGRGGMGIGPGIGTGGLGIIFIESRNPLTSAHEMSRINATAFLILAYQIIMKEASLTLLISIFGNKFNTKIFKIAMRFPSCGSQVQLPPNYSIYIRIC